MKKKVLTPWTGITEDFTPEDLAGFIYCVENTLTHRKYIGKKSLWSKLRKKVKGRKRRKLCVKESDWRFYKSSSLELKEDILRLGLSSFKFSVLSFHRTRAQMNYAETKELFQRDVLHSVLPDGSFEYYNGNILGKYYRNNT